MINQFTRIQEYLCYFQTHVIGLGPKFMSIYIQKLYICASLTHIERRIYYDEVEGLTAEWLDATCTLVLSLSTSKRFQRRGSPAYAGHLRRSKVVCKIPLQISLEKSQHGKELIFVIEHTWKEIDLDVSVGELL
ncbi:hypothetical protein ACET3Z_008605 [Daucus carota]